MSKGKAEGQKSEIRNQMTGASGRSDPKGNFCEAISPGREGSPIGKEGTGSRKHEVGWHGYLLALVAGLVVLSWGTPGFSQSKMELAAKLLENTNSAESSNSQSQIGHKSPALAALASFVVPGLGELYAGRYDVGKYSTIAEVSLWAFYTAVELYSSQVRNDAITYARIYSGAEVAGKSNQFFVNIGNFLNTQDYNIKKIHDGDYGNLYSSSSYQWQWQSDADRARFKALRIKADEYLNYGRYTAAVIILNHLISAVDAARLTAHFNASAVSSLDNAPGTEGVYLRVSAGF